jgi:tetratricopeptide (TPR) repeat protein
MQSLIILPIALFLLCPGTVVADIVYTKDGQELKGVITEDYHDRVVLSTVSGEAPILKQDIEKISYDSLEDNYLKLADSCRDRGDYKGALYYYNAVLRLNPDIKQAQEGSLLASNLLLQKKEIELNQQVRLKQDAEENRGIADLEKPAKDPLLTRREELLDKAGISLKAQGTDIAVDAVLGQSPAAGAGIKKGDCITAVWGKLVRYMQLKDAYDLLLASDVNETRLTISRKIAVNLRRGSLFNNAEKMIGGQLEVKFGGLTVTALTEGGPLSEGGAIQGDRISQIEDAPTRYMPLETVYKLIEKTRGDLLNVEVQREVVFWKR